MKIEMHGYETSISQLTNEDLTELIEILGVPREKYKAVKHYKTKELSSLEYGFGTAKRSIFIKLTSYHERYRIDQDTRVYGEYEYGSDMLKFRTFVSVELHGSFFDNSPDFNFSKYLTFLKRIGHKPKQMDIAYCDTEWLTTLDDWLRVFRYYSRHCIGNTILKSKIFPVEPDGIFQQVNIGSAATQNGTYATLYQRPDYLRLEMKYRNSEYLLYLADLYLADLSSDPEEYEKALLTGLVNSLDILTEKSMKDYRKRGDITKQVREPFYQAFIGSGVKKANLKELYETKKSTQLLSDEARRIKELKHMAGHIENFRKQWPEWTNMDLIEGLNILALLP